VLLPTELPLKENTPEVLEVLLPLKASMLLTTPTEEKSLFQGKQGLELKIIY